MSRGKRPDPSSPRLRRGLREEHALALIHPAPVFARCATPRLARRGCLATTPLAVRPTGSRCAAGQVPYRTASATPLREPSGTFRGGIGARGHSPVTRPGLNACMEQAGKWVELFPHPNSVPVARVLLFKTGYSIPNTVGHAIYAIYWKFNLHSNGCLAAESRGNLKTIGVHQVFFHNWASLPSHKISRRHKKVVVGCANYTHNWRI